MTRTEIEAMQRRIGTTPDSFWGPKSIAACQKHLRSLMPTPHPFPRPTQPELTAFYGPAGNVPMVQIDVPYFMWLYQRGTQRVTKISVHTKLAQSLHAVLSDIAKLYPKAHQMEATGMDLFFGCYSNRLMRGGSIPSLHARAAAVDFDAERNKNRSHWPTQSHMPLEVIEVFAQHGWLSAGVFWSRDAMHFEATRL